MRQQDHLTLVFRIGCRMVFSVRDCDFVTRSGCMAELFRLRIVLLSLVVVPSMIVAAVGYWRASSLGAIAMGIGRAVEWFGRVLR
jgi:hypothetical protein